MKTSNKTLNIIFIILILFLFLGCSKEDSSKYLNTDQRSIPINTNPSKLYTLWPLQLGPYYYDNYGFHEINCVGFWHTDQDTCNVSIKLHAGLTNFNRGLKTEVYDYYQIYNSPINGQLDIIKTVNINQSNGDFTNTVNIPLKKNNKDNYNLIASGGQWVYPNEILDTMTYNYTLHSIRIHSKTTNQFMYNSFFVVSHK
jgi:hypothetical protein